MYWKTGLLNPGNSKEDLGVPLLVGQEEEEILLGLKGQGHHPRWPNHTGPGPGRKAGRFGSWQEAA